MAAQVLRFNPLLKHNKKKNETQHTETWFEKNIYI